MKSDNQTSQESTNYRSILKSTSLIAGASILNIMIGMVRTKFIAIILGPVGVGLLGIFTQITSLISSLTGMGVGSSGVRQVAKAVGTGDDEGIARTVITLRRTAWVTGGFGLLVMIVFCVPLSCVTFGTSDHAKSIAVLGITLLTGAISNGQGCIINGTRRLKELAKISVIGAISSTLISIPCLILLGQEGIVPSLVLSALAVLATSWWFARRVQVMEIKLPWRSSYGEACQLLTLGVSFMGAGLVIALSNYLIRVIMLQQFSLTDIGIYQAAFNLSGTLVGFALGAMGADYYPRLTAVANNNDCVHRMINEQSQISILLSLPGLVAMMIFAPWLIKFFYATPFNSAVPILRWCILGILGRVFSWPLGFVLLAKGKGKLFFVTEVFAGILHLMGVFFFTRIWGLDGAGVAFMVLYIFYTCLMLYITHHIIGKTWVRSTFQLAFIATVIMGLLMLNCTLNPQKLIVWILNITILIMVLFLSLKKLSQTSGITIKMLLNKHYS